LFAKVTTIQTISDAINKNAPYKVIFLRSTKRYGCISLTEKLLPCACTLKYGRLNNK